MSSTRPAVRRPQPPGVYRRRRLMVAITVVGLVVATVDLVNGDGESPPADTVRQAGATPDPTQDATPRATPGSGGVAGPTTSRQRRRAAAPRATPTPAPAEPEGACADSDVNVRPEVAPSVAGGRVVVTLALNTRESEACTWTVSEEHLAFKILDSDGGDVWSSSDCPAQVTPGSVVVRRDLVSTYRVAWNGRESSRDCPDSMPAVAPGTYAVQAAAIGGEPSAVVRFRLRDPADLEPSEPVGPAVPKTKKKSTRARSRSASAPR